MSFPSLCFDVLFTSSFVLWGHYYIKEGLLEYKHYDGTAVDMITKNKKVLNGQKGLYGVNIMDNWKIQILGRMKHSGMDFFFKVLRTAHKLKFMALLFIW